MPPTTTRRSLLRRAALVPAGLAVAGPGGWPALAAGGRAEARLRVLAETDGAAAATVRALLDRYQRANPGVAAEIVPMETEPDRQDAQLLDLLGGGAPGPASVDVALLDVVRPAQLGAAGRLEPLDAYLGADRERLLAAYLPAYREAVQVEGRTLALPAWADALFLYYRRDLLEKYRLQPPLVWDDLVAAARQVVAGENDPDLHGIGFAAKPVEDAVCTFLVPYWQAGAELGGGGGRGGLDRRAAGRSFGLWNRMINDGLAPGAPEADAGDVRRELGAGNSVFALLGSQAWAGLKGNPADGIAGRIAVAPLPTFRNDRPATCLGGRVWAVAAASDSKPEAVRLIRYLADAEAAHRLAIDAAAMPAFPALYGDVELLEANPWFVQAKDALTTARPRPYAARYPDVSDTIRANLAAVLSRGKTSSDAIVDMESRLRRVLR